MSSLIKRTFAAATFSVAMMGASMSAPAIAADTYTLDSSHSQVVFSYNHLGFSTTYGMFSGFEGTLMLDEANPANSSVDVSIKTDSIITGWMGRDNHFKASDFFDAAKNPLVTFKSTKVEPTGDTTAKITGDLTMNGITKPVTIDAKLNSKVDSHPMKKTPWVGFDGTTTIKRTDFDLGKFAPYVGDEVSLMISIEAEKK